MTGTQITGAVTGLALVAGAATLWMAHQSMMSPAKKLRKSTTKAVHTIGNMVNSIEDAMK